MHVFTVAFGALDTHTHSLAYGAVLSMRWRKEIYIYVKIILYILIYFWVLRAGLFEENKRKKVAKYTQKTNEKSIL